MLGILFGVFCLGNYVIFTQGKRLILHAFNKQSPVER